MSEEPINIDFNVIAKEVQKLRVAFEALQKAGVDEEILIAYLHFKTKISVTQIKKLLKSEKDFFAKFGWYK